MRRTFFHWIKIKLKLKRRIEAEDKSKRAAFKKGIRMLLSPLIDDLLNRVVDSINFAAFTAFKCPKIKKVLLI